MSGVADPNPFIFGGAESRLEDSGYSILACFPLVSLFLPLFLRLFLISFIDMFSFVRRMEL